jgi:NAD(P)H-flavin reductase
VDLTLPVREVIRATPRARIIRLDLNGRQFPYAPGQAVIVGAEGQEKRRPYSIANAPEDAEREGWLELLVGVDADGVAGPHLPLEKGAPISVSGPIGRFTFPDQPEADRLLFIAGGTGIAPLRAMMRHALARPEHRIGLLYSARTPSEFAYESELRQLAATGRIELRQTITREPGPGDWTGSRGRIGRIEVEPLIHGAATLCFVCGPPALVTEIPPVLEELGVPRERIRTEEWKGNGK